MIIFAAVLSAIIATYVPNDAIIYAFFIGVFVEFFYMIGTSKIVRRVEDRLKEKYHRSTDGYIQRVNYLEKNAMEDAELINKYKKKQIKSDSIIDQFKEDQKKYESIIDKYVRMIMKLSPTSGKKRRTF